MSMQPRRLDKYELRQRLGHGGMAEVWKAYDTQLHRYVAIKVLHPDLQSDPSFITRFEREAQLIASLHHPNIIRIYDFHVSRADSAEETVAYMVMDYVEGQTLAHFLTSTSRAGKFPSSNDLLQLFTPICLAVDYAHQKGMIHRDIKPSNILLDRRDTSKYPMGEPILSDFGIARLLDTSTNTRSGWWMGTPLYTSPEQALGEAASERSDIYALSIILYEACTGALPFNGDNPTAIIMQHVNGAPIPPSITNPAISPALASVILRGLARQPEQRYSSASSLCVALAEALHLPVPEVVRQRAFEIADMHNPTFISPARPWPTTPTNSRIVMPSNPGFTPNNPLSNPGFTPNNPLSNPGFTPNNPLSNPGVPVGSYTPDHSATPSFATQAFSNTSNASNASQGPTPSSPGFMQTSPPIPQPAPPVQQSGKKGLRGRTIIPIILALVLILASMGALLVLNNQKPAATTPNPVAGHAYFLNSGQLNPDNSQGINDEMQLDLENVPAPQAGKAYYAWLLSDQLLNDVQAIPLGRLAVTNGSVHLFYAGTAQHKNMLAFESRILVTQENADMVPASYSPDTKSWVYYSKLPQAPSPKDKLHFSMLDHLRHLLSESPELKIRGLHGGLDIWFLRNSQKILEWANAARDEWGNSPDALHRQIIRILDYLDGAQYVQKDAPAVGTALLADPHSSQVALLGPVPDGQDPPGYTFSDEPSPGYIYLVSSHLAGTVLSPDATDQQRSLAAEVHVAIDRTRGWLIKAHDDAKQLLVMDNNQLNQPSTLALLDDLVTQTQQSYVGQTDPTTGQLYGGASWICSNIQRIANFELKPFKTQ